ncbi:glutamyl-tRNA reductase [Frigoribacterium sp. PvP032]|uniref:glutamyl-tRNA reductase n=1 Tax=Frigoribacterium sp. PvP032 TaxID=2806589 RepID=UPI001AE108A8|nr:glutamyl-tRNA reductase [Frigoribacterium sp. PvP032]MBP1189137.1 glutamyl-tRNA reductase [Frigoribacterium sp. PvP032]
MLICLTASHRNASFDLLEKLSIGAPSAASTLVDANDFVGGAVVLATCNRFEAYVDVEEPLTAAASVAVEATISTMSEASGIEADEMRDNVRVITGDEVVEHLFAVSSGLESVVIGEDEISGQVRRALEAARTRGTTSRDLERLFQKASQTSRGVKNRTNVGGAGRSLVRLALELASSRVTDWSQARVLIVGTGQYAATTVAALRDRGAGDLAVFSASGRASWFGLKHDLRPFDDLAEAISWSDVLITCTSTTEPVVVPEVVDASRRLVIDLGLPRNVDPLVARVPGVELLDLETISLHAPLAELTAADDARALVSSAAAEFHAVAAEQSLTPAVVALRRHVFDLLDAEIERARSRGDSSERTESALRHLAGVLLHTPSVRARELAREGRGEEFRDGLESLFGLTDTRTAAVEPAVLRPVADERLRGRDAG